MSYLEFLRQFQGLHFLPPASTEWVLPCALRISDEMRSGLAKEMSVLNAEYEVLAKKQAKILLAMGPILKDFDRGMRRIETGDRESHEQTQALTVIEAKL